jgi:polyhydroxyalkanoate synthesis regulator phasin
MVGTGKGGRMKVCVFVLALAAALAPAGPALAQVSDADLVQQLRADIQADRQALVTANLGLTDAEGEAFWPLYRAYRGEMSVTGDRLQKLILDYAAVWESPTPEQAKAMVDEMMAIEKQEHKVKNSYVAKFRKVLPEIKVARLLQIENKIDAIIMIGLADAIPLIATPE